MLEPVWAGCISASDDASIEWLQRTGTALFAWSSQARGFFTDRDNPELARSWHSEANFARRDRAMELARRKNTSMPAIALAYVIAQRFFVCALIGPLNLSELRSSLAALDTALTPEEADWLRRG
jgi:aryl-alcohol dehydrogenase-like predicted oxidoreductase